MQEAAWVSGDAAFAAATKDRAIKPLLAMNADAVEGFMPNAMEKTEQVLSRRTSSATRPLLWSGRWARTAEEASEQAEGSEFAAGWS